MTITAAAEMIIAKIRALYGNTRVSRATTKADLIAMRDEINMLIDTLDDVDPGEA